MRSRNCAVVNWVLAFGVLLSLGGCASLNFWSSPEEPSPERVHVRSASSGLNAVRDGDELQQPPLVVEVLDDGNDGKQLVVLLSVTSELDWPAEEVVVRLIGLEDGKQVRDESFTALELLQDVPARERDSVMLRAGNPYELVLAADAQGLTDYQIEVLWGDDARAMLKPEAMKAVTLENVRVSQLRSGCPGKNCLNQFQLEAEVVNRGSELVEEASLAIDFINKEQQVVHAELVSLGKLSLESGRGKSIRLLVDSPAQDSDGQPLYYPRLRVEQAG